MNEVEPTSARGGEIDCYYGSELAELGRWDKARTVLLAGRPMPPNDERFPIELGGVAFKQESYSEAARWLRLGQRLNPNDSYYKSINNTYDAPIKTRHQLEGLTYQALGCTSKSATRIDWRN